MRECKVCRASATLMARPYAVVLVSILVGMLVSVAVAAAPTVGDTPPLITKVTMTDKPDCVVITVEANAPMSPKIAKFTTQPAALALVIPGRMANGTMHKWVVKSGGIFAVRSVQFTTMPYVARIVASLGPDSHARTIESSNEGHTVVFTVYKTGYTPDSPYRASATATSKTTPPSVAQARQSSDQASIEEPVMASAEQTPSGDMPDELVGGWVGTSLEAPAVVSIFADLGTKDLTDDQKLVGLAQKETQLQPPKPTQPKIGPPIATIRAANRPQLVKSELTLREQPLESTKFNVGITKPTQQEKTPDTNVQPVDPDTAPTTDTNTVPNTETIAIQPLDPTTVPIVEIDTTPNVESIDIQPVDTATAPITDTNIAPSAESIELELLPIGVDSEPSDIDSQTLDEKADVACKHDSGQSLVWLSDLMNFMTDTATEVLAEQTPSDAQTDLTAGWVGEMRSAESAVANTIAAAVAGVDNSDQETLNDVWSDAGPQNPTGPTNNNGLVVDPTMQPDPDETAQAGFESHVLASGSKISVEFVETDIADILAGISVQTGLNVITGPEVTGKITLRLVEAEPDRVLRTASAMAGFSCELVGDTYLVGSAEGIEAVKLGGSSSLKVTKVLPAYYERPDDVAKMLTEHFKGLSASVNTISTGSVDAEKGGGAQALVITGTPAQVAAAQVILNEMAAIPASVRKSEGIEFYEAKYADPVDLMRILNEVIPEVRAILGPVSGFKAGAAGTAQKSSFTAGGGASGGGASGGDSGMIPLGGSGASSGGSATRAETTGAASNRLILMGTPDMIKQAVRILNAADIPEKQVLVHLRIADVTLTDTKKLGTTWDWANETWTEMTFSPKGEVLPDVSVIGDGISTRILNRTPMQITMTLDALYQNGNAKLLADPRISVLSNRQAVFFVGDKILYPVIAGVSNGTVLYTIETEEVGIGLDVIPQVAPDGTITLSIHPFVNSITQWVSTPQGDFPQTRKREAQTTIRVKDGETVAIGGLISDNDVETMSKLPIIGDLPILGKLFQHRHKEKTRSEVIVLITCETVGDLPAAESE